MQRATNGEALPTTKGVERNTSPINPMSTQKSPTDDSASPTPMSKPTTSESKAMLPSRASQNVKFGASLSQTLRRSLISFGVLSLTVGKLLKARGAQSLCF